MSLQAILFLTCIVAVTAGPPTTIVAPTDGTEASIAIQAAIDAAVAGDELFLPMGKYHCEQTIHFFNRTGLVLFGEEGTLIYQLLPGPIVHKSSHRTAFGIGQSDAITVSMLATLGPNKASTVPGHIGYGVYNATLYAEHAFGITDSTNIVISDVNISAPHGDGVYVGSKSSTVTVDNVSVYLNGRQGMSVTDASDVVITNCNISRSARSGIDIEPDGASWVVDGVRISGTTIDCHLLAFPSVGAGLVNNIVLEGNTVLHCASPWVDVRGSPNLPRYNWTVADNTVHLASRAEFAYVNNIRIRGNTVPSEHKSGKYYVGVHFDHVDMAWVDDNTFSGGCTNPPYQESNSTHLEDHNTIGVKCCPQPPPTPPRPC